MSLFDGMTAPYSSLEAWSYDRWIAPAVTKQWRLLERDVDDALPDGGSLLDVGCGGGQNAIQVTVLRPDARVHGVDLSAEQVRRARKRALEHGARVDFVEGSALELPFDDARFDVVLSVASIKHWPDQKRGVAECVRVLKPGGTLLVVEADRGCRLDDVLRFVADWDVPILVRRVMVPLFRTWVAGLAIDLDDARAIAAAQPDLDATVERIEGTPALIIRGTKVGA